MSLVHDLFGPTRASDLSADWPADWEKQFRRLYPNKVGMAKAVKKLDGLRRRGESFFAIQDGVTRYIAWLGEPGWRPSPKMPTTFLNQECWKDEFRSGENVQQSASQRAFDLAEQAQRIEAERGI